MAFDCSYLKETVGEALARGCADTVVAEPNDPVEYLGKWLLRYVKNAEVEGKFYMERDLQAEAIKKEQEDAQAAKAAEDALRAEKHKALEELAAAEEDPFILFKKAADLVEKYTDASASYVATIEKGDEPPGELAEEEAESEDEEAPPVPPEEGEEEEEPPAEELAEGGVEPNIVKFDYAGAFLRYVAATANDEETIKRIGTLTRPEPPAEDEPEPEEGEEKPKVIPLPPTFSMLDEQVPTMFIPNVADNPSISFFKRFPRMGSYFAAAVQSVEDEYKALICADTIVPAGSGKAFSQDDRDFIWDVSRSLTKALQARESSRLETHEGASFNEVFKQIEEQVTKTLYPPPEPLAEGETQPEPAPEEGAEEVEEEPPAEEEDDIARCQREIRNIEKYIAVADKAVASAAGVTEVRKMVLRLWATQIEAATADAVAEISQMTHTPQSTFHVIKALLYILKEDMGPWSSWPAARPLITPEFFQKVLAIDSTAERDVEAWTEARKELKACVDAKLPAECPKSDIGRLLRKYIRATRATANKAVIQREKEAEKAAKEAEKAAKEEELAGFEKAKADEEAAAAAAAEAEAAAAAEGEAEGEGEAPAE